MYFLVIALYVDSVGEQYLLLMVDNSQLKIPDKDKR